MRLLWSCAAVLTLVVTDITSTISFHLQRTESTYSIESLTCYTCEVEAFEACFKKTQVNCSAAQNRCFKAVAKFNGELLSIHDQGCIEAGDCVNVTSSILNVNYTITRHCCSTNLCNGAASTRLALCGALVLVWSQWGL